MESETFKLPCIADQTHNPYRQLVRRRFPEPLLLLLVFVLGVWLWDNHFGPTVAAIDPVQRADEWELTLRKTDRDLRLAAGTDDMPAWVQPLLGIDSMAAVLDDRIRALDKMVSGRHRHAETQQVGALADEGAYALGVLSALRDDIPAARGPFQQLGIARPPPPGRVYSRVIQGDEYWWDGAYLASLDEPGIELATRLVDARTRHLVSDAIKARGLVAALTFGGLVFLPGTLLAFLRAGKTPRPVRYPERWTLSFGLGVFLLAFLSYLGFSLTFNLALEHIASRPTAEGGMLLSMPFYITIDSLTRFLPALIAVALLFRRPRHAVSRLGLAGPLDGRMVLGGFAMIQILEFGLRMTFERAMPPDPTGGLSISEAGPWGLVLGIASACLAAPVAEEIVYRGVLFRSLANRLRLPLAVLISSAVFAVVHFYALPSLGLIAAVGVVCALCYAASRTLLTAIVLHALYNASIKIPEWVVYHTALS